MQTQRQSLSRWRAGTAVASQHIKCRHSCSLSANGAQTQHNVSKPTARTQCCTELPDNLSYLKHAPLAGSSVASNTTTVWSRKPVPPHPPCCQVACGRLCALPQQVMSHHVPISGQEQDTYTHRETHRETREAHSCVFRGFPWRCWTLHTQPAQAHMVPHHVCLHAVAARHSGTHTCMLSCIGAPPSRTCAPAQPCAAHTSQSVALHHQPPAQSPHKTLTHCSSSRAAAGAAAAASAQQAPHITKQYTNTALCSSCSWRATVGCSTTTSRRG